MCKPQDFRVSALHLAFLVAVGMFLTFESGPAEADVSYTPKSGSRVAMIEVTGEISAEDLQNFANFSRMALAVAESPRMYITRLDSVGGDMRTALAIGRIVREDRSAVSVLHEAECYSSCVLVLAGGAIRWVDGVIGIHRPFDPNDTNVTAESQKARYAELEDIVKSYLAEVNISAQLYDDMMRIPPNRIKILTAREMQLYGLSEDDPYDNAASIARAAKKLGISTQEYIARSMRADAECEAEEGIEEIARCRSEILLHEQ